MPARGRHQSTSKECKPIIKKIESIEGVRGVIIGHSYGGKSLGQNSRTGNIRIQRQKPGGLKAVTQSAKGIQELFIRVDVGLEDRTVEAIKKIVQVPGAPPRKCPTP
jgi:hypothetical protein